jgi:ribose transport system substrate-binding protein
VMAMGVLQALDSSGLSGKVLIGAYDNIEEVRNEMHNKRIHATIEQHPELMGEYGVHLAEHALSKKEIPSYTPTPLDLITADCFNKKIGISVSDLSNPFFELLRKGASDAANLFGFKVSIADAKNDDAKQLLDIQQFIKDKVDAIIINPTNVETVSSGIELAHNAGIKVITVDRKSSRDDLVLSHIASDNVRGGQLAAEFIAKQLNSKGSILELEGIPGTSAAHDRGMGFNQGIGKYPQIKVVARESADFDKSKAKEVVTQFIQKGISVDAVFAHNDNMILGAVEAYQTKTPKPIFVGFDAIPEAAEAVKQKKIAATIAQKPEVMGARAVQTAAGAFRGEKISKISPVDLDMIER